MNVVTLHESRPIYFVTKHTSIKYAGKLSNDGSMVSSLAITGVRAVRANGVKRAPRRPATAFGMAAVLLFDWLDHSGEMIEISYLKRILEDSCSVNRDDPSRNCGEDANAQPIR